MRNFLLKFILSLSNINECVNLSLNDVFLEKQFKQLKFKDISSIRYIKEDLLILSGMKTIFDIKYPYITIYSLNTLFGYSSQNNSIFNLEIDISFKIANIFLFSINFFNFVKKIYISFNYIHKKFDIGLMKNIYSNEVEKVEKVEKVDQKDLNEIQLNKNYSNEIQLNKNYSNEIQLNKNYLNLIKKLKEEPNFLLSSECLIIYKKCLTKIYGSFEDKKNLLEVKFLLNLIELKANIISMQNYDISKLIEELNFFYINYKLDLNIMKFFNSIYLKNLYNLNEDFKNNLIISFNYSHHMKQTFSALVMKFYDYINVNFGIDSDSSKDINCDILKIFDKNDYGVIYKEINKDELIQKNFTKLFIENLSCGSRETDLLKENKLNFIYSEIIFKIYLVLYLNLKNENEIYEKLNNEEIHKIIRIILKNVYSKLNKNLNLEFDNKESYHNQIMKLLYTTYQNYKELVIENLVGISKDHKMYNCYYSEKSKLNCKPLLNGFSNLLKSNSNSFDNNYKSFKHEFEFFKNDYKSNNKIKFIDYIKYKYKEYTNAVVSFEYIIFNKSKLNVICINLCASSLNDIETSLNLFLEYSKRASESYRILLTLIKDYKSNISIEKYTQSCLLKIVDLLKQYKLIFQKNMYDLGNKNNQILEKYLNKKNIDLKEREYYKLAYFLLEDTDFYMTNPFFENFIQQPNYILKQCKIFSADYDLKKDEWRDFNENNDFDVLTLFLYLKDQLKLKTNSNIISEESKKIGFYSMFSKKIIGYQNLLKIVKDNSLKGKLILSEDTKDHLIIDLDNTLDKTEKTFWEYVNYTFIDFSYTKRILESLKRNMGFDFISFIKEINKFIWSLNDDIKKLPSLNNEKINKLIENLKDTHVNMLKKLEIYVKDIRIYIKNNKESNNLMKDESENELEDDIYSLEEEDKLKEEGVLALIKEEDEEEYNERYITPINIVKLIICLPISEETNILAPFLNYTNKF